MEEVAHTSFYHLNDKTGVVCPGKCSRLVSYTVNDEGRSIDDKTGNFDPLPSESDNDASVCKSDVSPHLGVIPQDSDESDDTDGEDICENFDPENDTDHTSEGTTTTTLTTVSCF